MMHYFIYRRKDRTVAIGRPSPMVLDAMTGAGGLIMPGELEYEISKQVNDGKADAEVRPFYIGICYGGLTESDACDALARKDRPLDCVDSKMVDPVIVDQMDQSRRSEWRSYTPGTLEIVKPAEI